MLFQTKNSNGGAKALRLPLKLHQEWICLPPRRAPDPLAGLDQFLMQLQENNNCICISHSLWMSGAWTTVQTHTSWGCSFPPRQREQVNFLCFSFVSVHRTLHYLLKFFLLLSNLDFLPANTAAPPLHALPGCLLPSLIVWASSLTRTFRFYPVE